MFKHQTQKKINSWKYIGKNVKIVKTEIREMFLMKYKILQVFPDGSDGKKSTWFAGDLGLIPVLGRPTGGGQGNPLQYSCLENPHGQRSLADFSPRGCKESDMTERLSTTQHTKYPYWLKSE